MTKTFWLEKVATMLKVKSAVLTLRDYLKLTMLRKSLQARKNDELSLFLPVETHELDWPFRVILPTKGTWQILLGGHFQKASSFLCFQAPFFVKDCGYRCVLLRYYNGPCMSVFSLDVKDLSPSTRDLTEPGPRTC